jgi:hypothetical protein
MNMAVFWVVAPCSLVELYRRFRGAYCLHHQGDSDDGTPMTEAASTSEKPINFYKTARRNILENSHLRTLHASDFLSERSMNTFNHRQ